MRLGVLSEGRMNPYLHEVRVAALVALVLVTSTALYPQASNIPAAFNIEEIRRDYDRQSGGGSFLIISTPQAGETYVAGVEVTTGAFKVIRAPFIEMLDALQSSRNPQDAGAQFESYQFVLRNYPKCAICKLGLRNFAYLLINHTSPRQSSYGFQIPTSPGTLRVSEIKTLQTLVDWFPIEQKAPFVKRAEAVSLPLLETYILVCYYNSQVNDDEVRRIFWLRRPSTATLQQLRTVSVPGQETISDYLNTGLTLVAEPPLNLDEADELITLGRQGTEITPVLQAQVHERVEARHRAEAARMAELAAQQERERLEFRRTHYFICDEVEYYCALGTLIGTTCHSPLSGVTSAPSRPVCRWVPR